MDLLLRNVFLSKGEERARISTRVKALMAGNAGLRIGDKASLAYALYYQKAIAGIGADVRIWVSEIDGPRATQIVAV